MRRWFDDLPRLMRLGLITAALGGVIDIAHHLTAETHAAGHGPVALTGHLVTLVGMVTTMFGLFGVAFSRRPEEAKSETKGELT